MYSGKWIQSIIVLIRTEVAGIPATIMHNLFLFDDFFENDFLNDE